MRTRTILLLLLPVLAFAQTDRVVIDLGKPIGTNTIEFTASADGTDPKTYQWKFNGRDIPDAKSAVYRVQITSTGQAGDYSCQITNVAGTIRTNAVRVEVIPLPPPPAPPTNAKATGKGPIP